MTFFTLMIVMFADGSEVSVLYRSAAECGAALDTMPPRLETVIDSPVVGAMCDQSDKLSWTIRPRARGEK